VFTWSCWCGALRDPAISSADEVASSRWNSRPVKLSNGNAEAIPTAGSAAIAAIAALAAATAMGSRPRA